MVRVRISATEMPGASLINRVSFLISGCSGRSGRHRGMTEATFVLTISGPAVAELGLPVDGLIKVLAELVGRAAPAESELIRILRSVSKHRRAIAMILGGAARSSGCHGQIFAVA